MGKMSKIWEIFVRRTESVAILSCICVVMILALVTKGVWVSDVPLATTLRTTAFLGIIVVGQALLIIGGEFDLSVGSVYAFTGLIYVWLIGGLQLKVYKLVPIGIGLGFLPSFFIVMLLGLAIGVSHAFLVTKLRIPSLIVTLASLFIFRGLIYFITGGFPLALQEELRSSTSIKILGGGSLLGFNISILWLIIITVIFTIVLSYTAYGNHLQAVGRDPITALSQGVSPTKTKLIAFSICSILASFSGILSAGYFSSISTSVGEGMELEAIAAAVLGGCVIGGGIGSVWGAVLGAFLLLSVRTGLVMIGAPVYWYITFVGIALILVMVGKRYVGVER